ncbi:hypothetical protein LCGC14_1481780 [marine sediment metagenome]|uniref:Uncharacterized protein n=1 Tax=marine sediment metagenome TaxID=412755 RepID=A0A0F9J9C3_9ZZZZ
MNRQQIAAIYDSFPPEQQNIPRTEFIKRAMNTMNPVRCKKILDVMVQKKHQGRVQRAIIDSAITRKGER